MRKKNNPFIIEGFVVEGVCRENSYFVRFTDNDIMHLEKYADDMNYDLIPEVPKTDFEHPMRYKVLNRANPNLYGWISKTLEKVNNHYEENILYGFYKNGGFYNKYPITFNIFSSQVRSVLLNKAKASSVNNDNRFNKFLNTLKLVYGILDLEDDITCSLALNI